MLLASFIQEDLLVCSLANKQYLILLAIQDDQIVGCLANKLHYMFCG